MKILLIILSAITLSEAYIPFVRQCLNIPVVQNFDVNKYLGKWYEAEKYFTRYEFGGKCITATYTDEGNGVIGIFNKMINSKTNREISIKGTATLNGDPGEAKLSVVFPSVPTGPAPYWVIDTDYTSYSIVYSCTNSNTKRTRKVSVWILTREPHPSEELLNKAHDFITNAGIMDVFLIKTDHSNCPVDY